MNFILCNWVYDQADPELREEMRGSDWKNNKDWTMFVMWMTIEQYVFMGSIISGVFFMILRSLKKHMIEMNEKEDLISENTDFLFANRIVIENNEAYFSVLFTSLVLMQDENYLYNDEIKLCNKLFLIG